MAPYGAILVFGINFFSSSGYNRRMNYDKLLIQFCKEHTASQISVSKSPVVVAMKQLIHQTTEWLDLIKPSLSFRMHCILNNIISIPKCKACDNHVKMDSAYQREFTEYCSPACSRGDKTIRKSSLELLQNRDWLYEQRIMLRKSLELIGQELGCSEIPVRKWIKIHGIKKVRYNASDESVLKYLDDPEWLTEKHKHEHLDQSKMAEIIGSSAGTVSVYMKKHGVSANDKNSYERPFQALTKPMLEIISYIESIYDGKIEKQNRSVLGNLELDIYLPDKRIAIEYNGVYSHLYRPQEKSFSRIKGPNYHLTKTLECENRGITLLHIFSDSWDRCKNIWKSIIRMKLGVVQNRINARECVIKEIDTHIKNQFLIANHLQGQDHSMVKLGLFHNDELVAVMTFSTARYNKHYQWELMRFAVKTDHQIRGGFSKMLKHFRTLHSGSIISYANLTYSNGDVYRKNGFTLICRNPPTYWYVKKNTERMIHRSSFTKKKIIQSHPDMFQSGMTEFEMMQQLGYSKIYDCGTLAFGME